MADAPEKPWSISITYDAAHDVATAVFRHVTLHNAADVRRWRQGVEREFERIGKKVDLLIDLDGLVVRPAAARAFGQTRAEVLAKHTNTSVRFGGDAQTRATIFTSAVLDGAAANVHETRDAALRALLDDRKKRR